MRLSKNQIQFIINCDVEKLVSLLQEDYNMSIVDAFNIVYNSNIPKARQYLQRVVHTESVVSVWIS